MENKIHPWWPKQPAIYDINKTYFENAEEGPFFNSEIPERNWPDKSEWIDFLGHKVASPIGIPAGPLLNSSWIDLAGKLGFDIPTYKTIRSHEHPSHPLPNVVPVQTHDQLIPEKLPISLTSLDQIPHEIQNIGITNSFGNPSRTPEYLAEDIHRANAFLHEGQVMIVSVFGTEQEKVSLEDDFAITARFAMQCGAKIIEANFSCPNVNAKEGSLYSNPEMVSTISKKIVDSIADIPLIIKLGLFQNPEQLRETMIAAARSGVRAICGINTISMSVVDAHGKPTLGESRKECGICGNPIREAALKLIREAAKINREEKLDLVLMGTGGAMIPEHFDEFLEAGADVAMSATGMMWDPLLAMRYHKEIQCKIKN